MTHVQHVRVDCTNIIIEWAIDRPVVTTELCQFNEQIDLLVWRMSLRV